MTLAQTRKLGIEFERRIQTMIPDSEFANKLDTETIYSYLNQYQDKYIHEIFRNLDAITPGTKIQAHVNSVLQPLLHTKTILVSEPYVQQHIGSVGDESGNVIIDTARSINYPLDETFYMYVRSVSNVEETYSFRGGRGNNETIPIRILPNQLISLDDLWRLLETPHDSLRILRYPAAVLTEEREIGGDLIALHDMRGDTEPQDALTDQVIYNVDDTSFNQIRLAVYYGSSAVSLALDSLLTSIGISDSNKIDGKIIGISTSSNGRPEIIFQIERDIKKVPTLTVIYDQYTKPRGIKVTYYKEPNHFSLMTSTPCELPMDVFEEIVSGAVDLYVQYVAGAEARKRQLEEARRQAAKEQEANNARRNRNEE